MTSCIMEIDQYATSDDTDMEVDRQMGGDNRDEDLQRDTLGFWEILKQKLDDELKPDELERITLLINDKLGKVGIGGHIVEHPRDLLSILENNMLTDDALSVLKHAFSIMDIYPEYEKRSFGQMFADVINTRKTQGLSSITGREAEIKEAYQKIKHSKGVWIHGMGGLGKSSVAREICYRFYCQSWDVKIIDLKGVTTPIELIRRVLCQLDNYTSNNDLEGMVAELIYQVKSTRNSTCFLLDNIDDLYTPNGEVHLILQRLWNSPDYMPLKVKWIVTSRCPCELEIESFELQPLQGNIAETLLRQSCRNVVLPKPMFNKLLEMTCGIPLAIRLLASAIKSYPQRYVTEADPEDLLMEVKENATKRCFQKAYDSLTQEERYQLSMLSVVETSQFNLELVRYVLNIEIETAVILMMTLTNKHIVQQVQDMKEKSVLQYCLHPLVFDIIKINPVPIESKNNFIKYMIGKIEPQLAKYDSAYLDVSKVLSTNIPLLKVLMQNLNHPSEDTLKELNPSRNRYLSKLLELLQMTPKEQEEFHKNLIKSLRSSDRKQLRCFWEIEQIHVLVNSQRYSDAESLIQEIGKAVTPNDVRAVTPNDEKAVIPNDEKAVNTNDGKAVTTNDEKAVTQNDEFDVYLQGRFYYHKGRFLRCKKEKQIRDAIKDFETAIDLFKKCRYTTDQTMALNAIGNAYFDDGNLDKALCFHKQAADILEQSVAGSVHPDVAVFKFNIGTIYLKNAQQYINIYGGVTEEVKPNLEKALKIFNESMKLDVQMGMQRRLQYAQKLDQRAHALLYLKRYDDAMSDEKEAVKLLCNMYESPNQNITLAYFKCGRRFLEWCQSLERETGTDISKRLRREALVYFIHAENEMRKDNTACLHGNDKSDFIMLYRQLSEHTTRTQKGEIKAFCDRFEKGVTVNSSSSSESESSRESSPDSKRSSSNSDEGVVIYRREQGGACGIPSAQIQKEEAEQYQKDFFAKMNELERSSEIKKKRRLSSDSD